MDAETIEAQKNNRRLQNLMKKQRLEREHADRLATLTHYYAGTSVPVERVAEHMGIDVDEARRRLRGCGRAV